MYFVNGNNEQWWNFGTIMDYQKWYVVKDKWLKAEVSSSF